MAHSSESFVGVVHSRRYIYGIQQQAAVSRGTAAIECVLVSQHCWQYVEAIQQAGPIFSHAYYWLVGGMLRDPESVGGSKSINNAHTPKCHIGRTDTIGV